MARPDSAQSSARIRDMLDEALDDLPRYFAVVDQPVDGVMVGEHQPHMVCCVTVDDVRKMLRRKLLRAAGETP